MNEVTTKRVFALRKQGDLDAALQLARPYYATHKDDTWGIRALAWTLYDCIKRDRDSGKLAEARQFADEFQKLNVTATTDEVLFKLGDFVLKSVAPESQELAEAKALSKAGNHADAAKVLRHVVVMAPHNAEAQTSLGWELYRLLRTETVQKQMVTLIREYAKLKLVAKPDLLHSCILMETCKLAESWSDFAEFVRWWDTAKLTPEDWAEGYGKDGTGPYPSLAAKVATALYKNAKKFHNRGPAFQWILPYIRKVMELTDSDWIPYYLAKMSTWFEADLSGVRELLVPLVKVKQREFWAWQALAECSVDRNERMALYASAVISPVTNEDYKADVYHQYALFLAQEQQHTLASLVLTRYVAIQKKNNRTIDPAICAIQQSSWFETTSHDDLNERLLPLADQALQILFKDHPVTTANFIELLAGTDGRPPLALVLIKDKGPCKVKNRCTGPGLPDCGAPVEAKIFWPPISARPVKPGEAPHAPPLGELYNWQPRTGGHPFDCAKESVGVVSQVNDEKGFARVSLGPKTFGLLYYDRWKDAQTLILGDVMTLWTQDIPTPKEGFVQILNFVKTERRPLSDFYRVFEGLLDIRTGNAYGFVKNGESIFVAPPIISRLGLPSGVNVKGWAIREWNQKRAELGWSALLVELVQRHDTGTQGI